MPTPTERHAKMTLNLTGIWNRRLVAEHAADDADLAERIAEFIDLDDPDNRRSQVEVTWPAHCRRDFDRRITSECSFAWLP